MILLGALYFQTCEMTHHLERRLTMDPTDVMCGSDIMLRPYEKASLKRCTSWRGSGTSHPNGSGLQGKYGSGVCQFALCDVGTLFYLSLFHPGLVVSTHLSMSRFMIAIRYRYLGSVQAGRFSKWVEYDRCPHVTSMGNNEVITNLNIPDLICNYPIHNEGENSFMVARMMRILTIVALWRDMCMVRPGDYIFQCWISYTTYEHRRGVNKLHNVNMMNVLVLRGLLHICNPAQLSYLFRCNRFIGPRTPAADNSSRIPKHTGSSLKYEQYGRPDERRTTYVREYGYSKLSQMNSTLHLSYATWQSLSLVMVKHDNGSDSMLGYLCMSTVTLITMCQAGSRGFCTWTNCKERLYVSGGDDFWHIYMSWLRRHIWAEYCLQNGMWQGGYHVLEAKSRVCFREHYAVRWFLSHWGHRLCRYFEVCRGSFWNTKNEILSAAIGWVGSRVLTKQPGHIQCRFFEGICIVLHVCKESLSSYHRRGRK